MPVSGSARSGCSDTRIHELFQFPKVGSFSVVPTQGTLQDIFFDGLATKRSHGFELFVLIIAHINRK